MDTTDRSDESMSGNLRTPEIQFVSGEPAAAPRGRSGGVFRRITRNWASILLLWVVISSALAYGIYRVVEPTYRATAMVKVESNLPDLFGPSLELSGRGTQPTYLLTEIETMKSNPVLELALTRNNPSIINYSLLRQSKDPKNDLRMLLAFDVVPNTHWIRVAVETTAPDEARDYVNAVINAYEETAVNNSLGTPTNCKLSMRNQTANKIAEGFKAYEVGLERKIQEIKDKLLSLARSDDALASKTEQESRGERGPVKPVTVRAWNSHVNEMEESFLRDDLDRLNRIYDQINRKLEALEFNQGKAGIEIMATEEAELPKVPNSNERTRYMAIAPAGVLVLLLGLFLAFGGSRQGRGRA